MLESALGFTFRTLIVGHLLVAAAHAGAAGGPAARVHRQPPGPEERRAAPVHPGAHALLPAAAGLHASTPNTLLPQALGKGSLRAVRQTGKHGARPGLTEQQAWRMPVVADACAPCWTPQYPQLQACKRPDAPACMRALGRVPLQLALTVCACMRTAHQALEKALLWQRLW